VYSPNVAAKLNTKIESEKKFPKLDVCLHELIEPLERSQKRRDGHKDRDQTEADDSEGIALI